ncbi:MAG: ECF transporter S component [Erysipelotrichaceae bacterium]
MIKTKNIVTMALTLAAIFIFTAFISFPMGSFGFLNLGDALILVFSGFFHPVLAFLIAGIASLMADVSLGYMNYALFTFVIKGLEALVVSLLIHKYRDKLRLVWFVIGIMIMLVGYGLTDVFLSGQAAMFLPSLGWNAIQGIGSLIVAMIAYPSIAKVMHKSM